MISRRSSRFNNSLQTRFNFHVTLGMRKIKPNFAHRLSGNLLPCFRVANHLGPIEICQFRHSFFGDAICLVVNNHPAVLFEENKIYYASKNRPLRWAIRPFIRDQPLERSFHQPPRTQQRTLPYLRPGD